MTAATLFDAQRHVRTVLAGVDLAAAADRLVADAISSALPAQWEARARVFEDCRPRPGDFLGRDPNAAGAIDARCSRMAAACRIHAAGLRGDDLSDPRFAADLRLLEVAA